MHFSPFIVIFIVDLSLLFFNEAYVNVVAIPYDILKLSRVIRVWELHLF